MKKKLIVNADDFGRNPCASEAILKLGGAGRITSTTIMANLVRPDDLKALLGLPALSTGFHLNLVEGTPVSPPEEVPSLVDSRGRFLGHKTFLARFYTFRISRTEVETEIRAQIHFLRDSGVRISHADSHKHLHQHPLIGPFILQILGETGITKIRRCRLSQRRISRMRLLDLFYRQTKNHLGPFTTPDILISYFSCAEDFNGEAFQSAVHAAFQDHNTAEIMCHPSTEDRADTYLHGLKEFKFLLEGDWKDRLEEEGISLINYHQL